MHDYNLPIEVVRMVLAIGIMASVLVYERWHIAGGAIVVAGYLGMFVDRPVYILTTIGVAIATYFIVDRFIAQRIFLYGRRRLTVMVMTGMVLQLITSLIAYQTSKDIPLMVGLFGVGFVLPGLIAQDIERQGIKLTILTLLGTVAVTYALFTGIMAIKSYLPITWSAIPHEAMSEAYSYHTQLLIPAVILSVIMSVVLFEKTGIRSGGFLTAAYAALFFLRPANLAFILVIACAVYLFVNNILLPRLHVFGRTKFAIMLLTGLVFTWIGEILVGGLTEYAFIPLAGFAVIRPMIASLIANDSEHQGLPKTLLGVAICTSVVFVLIKTLDILVIG